MAYSREDGRQLAREVFGEGLTKLMDANAESKAWGSDIGELALKFAFGEVWTRPGLDRRSRSLVTLGILIALRASSEIKFHTLGALGNGLTAEELQEVLIQAIPYAGFPSVATVSSTVADVLKEKGLI